MCKLYIGMKCSKPLIKIVSPEIYCCKIILGCSFFKAEKVIQFTKGASNNASRDFCGKVTAW